MSRSESDRIVGLRQEAGEVKELLHQNLDKLNERQENLDSLSDRSQILQERGSEFVPLSSTLHRKYWWRSIWIWVMFWIILVVIMGCLIAWLVASYEERDD